jgi:hypothetical protein
MINKHANFMIHWLSGVGAAFAASLFILNPTLENVDTGLQKISLHLILVAMIFLGCARMLAAEIETNKITSRRTATSLAILFVTGAISLTAALMLICSAINNSLNLTLLGSVGIALLIYTKSGANQAR